MWNGRHALGLVLALDARRWDGDTEQGSDWEATTKEGCLTDGKTTERSRKKGCEESRQRGQGRRSVQAQAERVGKCCHQPDCACVLLGGGELVSTDAKKGVTAMGQWQTKTNRVGGNEAWYFLLFKGTAFFVR
ncbi:hypothetical protein TRVL_07187 [Trypanosoma vivax]|nr:hypothetical protein TRVL_07187 [Trypanosoma vivax]